MRIPLWTNCSAASARSSPAPVPSTRPPLSRTARPARVCGGPVTWSPSSHCPDCGDIGLGTALSASRCATSPLSTVTGMKNKQGAPSLPDGWALEWLPAERLEDGLEAREILARGRSAGLIVHQHSLRRKRNHSARTDRTGVGIVP